jgi:hypothetical protein
MMTPTSKREKKRHGSAALGHTAVVLLGVAAIGLIVGAGVWLTGRQRSAPVEYEPEYSGGARAEVVGTVIDHGDVPFNRFVESVFTIQNVGDQPLQILDVPQVVVVEGC